MSTASKSALILNGGSSSIRFALYTLGRAPERGLHGKIERIGLPDTALTFTDPVTNRQTHCPVGRSDRSSAIQFLVDWLEKQAAFGAVASVGHRVVHGMDYTEPQRITQGLLDELRRISAYDPDHLPGEIELIEAFGIRHPHLVQIACFDTAFHQTMPRVAQLLPIPRRFDRRKIRRYGFHGISYAYLLDELAGLAGHQAANGRVILAHLGSGASLAAVRDGKSVDTSMGFTPAAGLPMGTRPGDLDPGVAWYLMQSEALTPAQFNTLINQESGLLGVSEISSDMRDLLEQQKVDIRAAEAVELFCYQTRKWIGAFSAVLGGLDTLVFSGGIGEKAAEIRMRICQGLGFLGIELDEQRNAADAGLISAESGRVAVRVIPTDEETMIARTVSRLLEQSAE